MITRHPTEPTLAAYAAGSLPYAIGLIVATHLGQCPTCRRALDTLEATGGALLEDLPPVSLAPAALDQLLGRVDEPAPPSRPILNPDLPAPLNRTPLGRWWPAGRGIRYRPLRTTGPAWGGLLLVQPGRSLMPHGHIGLELTCVLSGAFVDGDHEYGAGDLAEPAADHDQPPIVIGTDPCLCVIATEGVRMHGILGWVQRRFGP